MFTRLAVTVAFLAITACAAVGGDTQRGSIRGTVRDASGAVVPEASVCVQDWKFNEFVQHPKPHSVACVQTDRDGHFLVELPAGLYALFVSRPEFTPLAKKVRVDSGKSASMNVKFKFDPLVRWVE
jgi:hypothetical protein